MDAENIRGHVLNAADKECRFNRGVQEVNGCYPQFILRTENTLEVHFLCKYLY